MARPKSKSREALITSAMHVFWKRGYTATSIEDLVQATGVGRGGIYADVGGKDALLLKCLENYRETFIAPALERLASDASGLAGIETFFDHFIALHAAHGMPGPGCFMGSTMTELAPHNADVRAIVDSHMAQLSDGFLQALRKDRRVKGARIPKAELVSIARFLATTSQGLWSAGRTMDSLRELTDLKAVVFDLLDAKLSRAQLEAAQG